MMSDSEDSNLTAPKRALALERAAVPERALTPERASASERTTAPERALAQERTSVPERATLPDMAFGPERTLKARSIAYLSSEALSSFALLRIRSREGREILVSKPVFAVHSELRVLLDETPGIKNMKRTKFRNKKTFAAGSS